MGRGHIRRRRVRDRGGRSVHPQGEQHRQWVIQRFYEIVEAGRTYGPYLNSENGGHRRKPFWVWTAAQEEAFDVLQLLAPWLSPRRINRACDLSGIRFPRKCLPI